MKRGSVHARKLSQRNRSSGQRFSESPSKPAWSARIHTYPQFRAIRWLALAVTMALAVTGAAVALDFEVTPDTNGSLDVSASHTVVWSDRLWSSVSLLVENPLFISQDDASYIALSGTSMELSADIIGFRPAGDAGPGIALNLLYNPATYNEVGYVDAAAGRWFLINERRLDLILPRIRASYAGRGAVSFSVSGELAPWFMVVMRQDLDVTPPGSASTEYSLPQSIGSGMWAASADVTLTIPGRLFSPEVRAGFDSVPVAYTSLDTAGNETALDTLILNLRILAGGRLLAFGSGSAAPRLLAGYEWNRVKNNTTGEWIVMDGRMLLVIGLSMQ